VADEVAADREVIELDPAVIVVVAAFLTPAVEDEALPRDGIVGLRVERLDRDIRRCAARRVRRDLDREELLRAARLDDDREVADREIAVDSLCLDHEVWAGQDVGEADRAIPVLVAPLVAGILQDEAGIGQRLAGDPVADVEDHGDGAVLERHRGSGREGQDEGAEDHHGRGCSLHFHVPFSLCVLRHVRRSAHLGRRPGHAGSDRMGVSPMRRLGRLGCFMDPNSVYDAIPDFGRSRARA